MNSVYFKRGFSMAIFSLITMNAFAMELPEDQKGKQKQIAKMEQNFTDQKLILIDRDDNKITLSAKKSAALLKCGTIKVMIQDMGDYKVYFETLPEFVTSGLLRTIIDCCDNDRIIEISKSLAGKDDIALLKLANFLDAPANVMHLFANRAWPLLQDKIGDSQEIKAEKKQLRLIAEPHLANPGHVAEYLKQYFIDIKALDNAGGLINISHTALAPFITNHDGWFISEKDGLLYNAKFKFGSLKDLDILMRFGFNRERGSGCQRLNISGHALTHYPLKDVLHAFSNGVSALDLSDNVIQILNAEKVEEKDGCAINELIIKNNPITTIDDSFYQMVYNKRNKCAKFELTLENTALTEKQKKEARAKFYAVTHTIPQRFIRNAQSAQGAIQVVGLLGLITGGVGSFISIGKLIDKFVGRPSTNVSQELRSLLFAPAFAFSAPFLATACGLCSIYWFNGLLQGCTGLTHPELASKSDWSTLQFSNSAFDKNIKIIIK